VTLLTEHDRTLGKLTALANAAGHQKKFRFAACRRGILYKLAKALPHEYSRPDKLYARSYGVFLENFVNFEGAEVTKDENSADENESTEQDDQKASSN